VVVRKIEVSLCLFGRIEQLVGASILLLEAPNKPLRLQIGVAQIEGLDVRLEISELFFGHRRDHLGERMDLQLHTASNSDSGSVHADRGRSGAGSKRRADPGGREGETSSLPGSALSGFSSEWGVCPVAAPFGGEQPVAANPPPTPASILES